MKKVAVEKARKAVYFISTFYIVSSVIIFLHANTNVIAEFIFDITLALLLGFLIILLINMRKDDISFWRFVTRFLFYISILTIAYSRWYQPLDSEIVWYSSICLSIVLIINAIRGILEFKKMQ